MKKILTVLLILVLSACTLPAAQATAAFTELPPTQTPTFTAPPPSETPPTATLTEIPSPTATSTSTPPPVVESLDAVVTADLLSCRYGPGAEYLYFYGFKKGMKLKLNGRTDGNNWVAVDGLQHLCWVNAKFLEINGDRQTLPVIYPGGYALPVSPYYAAPVVYSAKRDDNNVTVIWSPITLRAGDEEDDSMLIYIVEVWRCEGGQMIFDPLATNEAQITFWDEGGCAAPSHGRVFFQEKHGFAGPAEIPFP
ncbi:MAG: hypothetical protein Fur002_12310 [Anaerolineales bacterium]